MPQRKKYAKKKPRGPDARRNELAREQAPERDAAHAHEIQRAIEASKAEITCQFCGEVLENREEWEVHVLVSHPGEEAAALECLSNEQSAPGSDEEVDEEEQLRRILEVSKREADATADARARMDEASLAAGISASCAEADGDNSDTSSGWSDDSSFDEAQSTEPEPEVRSREPEVQRSAEPGVPSWISGIPLPPDPPDYANIATGASESADRTPPETAAFESYDAAADEPEPELRPDAATTEPAADFYSEPYDAGPSRAGSDAPAMIEMLDGIDENPHLPRACPACGEACANAEDLQVHMLTTACGTSESLRGAYQESGATSSLAELDATEENASAEPEVDFGEDEDEDEEAEVDPLDDEQMHEMINQQAIEILNLDPMLVYKVQYDRQGREGTGFTDIEELVDACLAVIEASELAAAAEAEQRRWAEAGGSGWENGSQRQPRPLSKWQGSGPPDTTTRFDATLDPQQMQIIRQKAGNMAADAHSATTERLRQKRKQKKKGTGGGRLPKSWALPKSSAPVAPVLAAAASWSAPVDDWSAPAAPAPAAAGGWDSEAATSGWGGDPAVDGTRDAWDDQPSSGAASGGWGEPVDQLQQQWEAADLGPVPADGMQAGLQPAASNGSEQRTRAMLDQRAQVQQPTMQAQHSLPGPPGQSTSGSNGKRALVLDGANVAWSEAKGEFCTDRISACIRYWESRGWERDQITAFVPNYLLDERRKRRLNDLRAAVRTPSSPQSRNLVCPHPTCLGLPTVADSAPRQAALEAREQLVRTPANSNDDLYVIHYAMKMEGLIVTNDLYRKEISGANREHWKVSVCTSSKHLSPPRLRPTRLMSPLITPLPSCPRCRSEPCRCGGGPCRAKRWRATSRPTRSATRSSGPPSNRTPTTRPRLPDTAPAASRQTSHWTSCRPAVGPSPRAIKVLRTVIPDQCGSTYYGARGVCIFLEINPSAM